MTARVAIPRAELHWRFSRSGGPGGQGVNTADSKAELRFDLEGSPSVPGHLKARAAERLAGRLVDGSLVIVSSEHRAQLANRKAAEARLVALLADAFAPPAAPRRPTKVSRGRLEARMKERKARSETKRLRRDQGDWKA